MINKYILQRGCPATPSQYLTDNLGDLSIINESKIPLYFISPEGPVWLNTIKGDDVKGDFPALIFLNEIVPMHLGEYSFIENLLLPEVPFSEIIIKKDKENEQFVNQQVDFYLEQARLVIEIDGISHKNDHKN